MHSVRLVLSLSLAFATAPAASLAASTDELAELRQQIAEMKRQHEERIRALEERLQAAEREVRAAQRSPVGEAPATAAESPLDRAVAELPPRAEPSPSEPAAAPSVRRELLSTRIGGAEARLIDVSLTTNLAAGWSSRPNDIIEVLEGGEHDPKRRGFTLQQAELGLHGAVDPYFTATAFVLFGEEGVELEEAFFTTTSLPYDLQLEGGFFLTEFGRNNPRHLDEWDWLDQPVINTRIMGSDGSRAAGFRLGWLLPTAWYSEFQFGAQDPSNAAMASFLGNPPAKPMGTEARKRVMTKRRQTPRASRRASEALPSSSRTLPALRTSCTCCGGSTRRT